MRHSGFARSHRCARESGIPSCLARPFRDSGFARGWRRTRRRNDSFAHRKRNRGALLMQNAAITLNLNSLQ
jgi:hypothetical protein